MNCVFWPEHILNRVMFAEAEECLVFFTTLVNNSSNIVLANSQGSTIACVTKSVIIRRHMLWFVSTDDEKQPRWVLTCPSVGCFFLPKEAIISQAKALHGPLFPCSVRFMYWRWIFYWAVSLETKIHCLPALFTVRIVRCLYYTWGTSKSRSKRRNEGKNGAVITKKYTARDDVKLNTQGDLKIRVFGIYEWVFVRVILKLIAFLTKLIA